MQDTLVSSVALGQLGNGDCYFMHKNAVRQLPLVILPSYAKQKVRQYAHYLFLRHLQCFLQGNNVQSIMEFWFMYKSLFEIKIQVGTAVMTLCSYFKLWLWGLCMLEMIVNKWSIYLQVLVKFAATDKSVLIGDFMNSNPGEKMSASKTNWAQSVHTGRQLILSGCTCYLS